MTDEKHLFLAWNMVQHTTKVTDAERSEARLRILSAASKMGVDMSRLKKIATLCFESTSLSAMAIEMPTVDDHPNKMEFSGVLTKVDEASDLAPHGSYGKKVLIPREVAEAALPTLMGMAIDFADGMKGHNRKRKIGIVTAGNIVGNEVQIKGFIYANDFPDEVSMIQANKEDLGFSFEAERILVSDLEQDPLRIESMVFTGAAVLKKKNAAYHSTSIAASAEENEMTKEELAAALAAALSPITTRLDAIEKTRIEAASVADKVASHAAALKSTATAMTAAGVGCHATRGHAAILNHMADSMMSEAHQGRIPSEYHGMSMYSAADQLRIDAAAAEKDAAVTKEMKELRDGLAASKTTITDLQAQVQKLGAPERKTLPARISSLMARASLTAPADGGKFTIPAIDAALKGTSLSPQERMEVKLGLRNAKLLEEQTA